MVTDRFSKFDKISNFLYKSSFFISGLLLLLSFFIVNLKFFWWPTNDDLLGAVLPAVVVDLTNSERNLLSKNPLQRNLSLDQAANLKAEHMAKNHYFAHHSPDGVSPWFWFKEVGYDFVHAGENLAVYFNDSKDVVEAWMNSPSHKANIIDQKYTEIGVGVAEGVYNGYETVFVVQLFATPKNLTKQDLAPIANQEDIAVLDVVNQKVVYDLNQKPTVLSEQIQAEDEVLVLLEVEAGADLVIEQFITEEFDVAVVTEEVNHLNLVEDKEFAEISENESVWFSDVNNSLNQNQILEPDLVSSIESDLTDNKSLFFTVSLSLLLQWFYLVLVFLVALVLLVLVAVDIYRRNLERVLFGITVSAYVLFLLAVHSSFIGIFSI